MSTSAPVGLMRTRRGQVILGVTACAVAGVAICFALWGRHTSNTPAYNNVSQNYRVCMMTDASDTADASAAQATWAGLQKAASSGRVNAERLALGGVTTAAAAPYINGAVQEHCGLIVAAGGDVAAAIRSSATADTHQEFLLVGGESTQRNVRTIPAGTPSTITSSTYSLVADLAGH